MNDEVCFSCFVSLPFLRTEKWIELFVCSCSLIDDTCGLILLSQNIEEDRLHGKELPNSERGVPEGSGEMQEEAQRTHRREKLCSYHAPIGVSDSLYLSL